MQVKRITTNIGKQIILILRRFLRADYPIKFINSIIKEYINAKEIHRGFLMKKGVSLCRVPTRLQFSNSKKFQEFDSKNQVKCANILKLKHFFQEFCRFLREIKTSMKLKWKYLIVIIKQVNKQGRRNSKISFNLRKTYCTLSFIM